jgi:hypothetical protein
MALLLSACASASVEEPGHEETEVRFWMSPTYDGATVCVRDSCGVVGEEDTLVVSPGIVGSSFDVHITRGDTEVTLEAAYETDLEFLRIEPETARAHAASLLLLRLDDGSCAIGITNLEVEDQVAFGEYPPDRTEQLCGPFAEE